MAEESRIDELSQSESCADDNIPPTQPEKLQPAPSGMAFLKSKTQQIYVIIKLTQNSMISALLMNDVAPVFFLPVPYSFLRSIAGAPSDSSTKGTHVTWSGETGTSEAAKAQVQKQPADGEQLPKKPRPNKRPAAAVSQVEAKADTTQEGEVEAGLLP